MEQKQKFIQEVIEITKQCVSWGVEDVRFFFFYVCCVCSGFFFRLTFIVQLTIYEMVNGLICLRKLNFE